MRIGIDLDGVCFDFVTPFLEFYNKYHNANHETKDITDYKWYRCLPDCTEDKFYEALQAFNDEGGWRRVPLYPGVEEALKTRVEKGDTLHVITARTGDGLPAAMNIFQNKGIFASDYHSVTGAEEDKGVVAVRFNVDVHLEDHPKQCVTVASRGIPVVCITHRYNKQWEIPWNLPIVRERNASEALRQLLWIVRSAKSRLTSQ